MSGLYIVADDLTGALDSAAPFCAVHGPIPVYLDALHADDTTHASVDLATRDAAPGAGGEIGATAVPVLQRLARADIAYKKIDSRLRGHWAAELADLLRTGIFGGCVFAPAFPSQGRTTRHGLHWVSGPDGAVHPASAELLAGLRGQGLRVAQTGLDKAVRDGTPRLAEADVMVFDALTDADLQAIVDAVPAQIGGKPVLWCGSGGLARALARGPTPVPLPSGSPTRPTLAIVGTDHEVSRLQVERAASLGSICHVVVHGDGGHTADRVGSALEHGSTCLVTFAFPPCIGHESAAASIERYLSLSLPRLVRPASLVVTGGQTLRAVCRAVGATHLEVVAERSPGVPCSRIRGGIWEGVHVVSKSGGFGDPAWLVDLLADADFSAAP